MGKADKRARKRQNQQQARIEREAAAKRAGRMRQIRFGGIGVAVVVIVVAIVAFTGGSDKKKTATTTTTRPVTTTAEPRVIQPTKTYVATITTNFGTIKVKLDPKDDPIGTNHFVRLIQEKFYDGLTWHHAAKDFVIQGGDPQGDGSGTPKSTVKAEVPTDHYPVGSIAAAKTGADPPGTFGNQFFIVTGSQGATLPNQYARFGTVISGLAVAKQIEALAPASGDGAPTKPATIIRITVGPS